MKNFECRHLERGHIKPWGKITVDTSLIHCNFFISSVVTFRSNREICTWQIFPLVTDPSVLRCPRKICVTAPERPGHVILATPDGTKAIFTECSPTELLDHVVRSPPLNLRSDH